MVKVLPEQFLKRLTDIVGQSLSSQLEKTFVERPTTFRVNTIKSSKHEIMSALDDAGVKVKNVQWYGDAFILQNKSKRELMELPIYTEGKIYIQSLASMCPPVVLRPEAGDKVLDLTAAPGSKTSQIAAFMGREGELVANDNNKVRFFKLMHNMEMLGVVGDEKESFEDMASVETSPSPSPKRRGDLKTPWQFTLRMEDGSHLCGEYQNYFDKILVDAPCSAEARFVDGDPKTYGYWNEKKIKEMAMKQRKLLFSAWYALKPGGTLVYSTCTFAPEENELQISKLLERFQDEIEMLDVKIDGLKILSPLKKWKDKEFHSGVQKAIRILPTSEIEGFFVAKLKKKIID